MSPPEPPCSVVRTMLPQWPSWRNLTAPRQNPPSRWYVLVSRIVQSGVTVRGWKVSRCALRGCFCGGFVSSSRKSLNRIGSSSVWGLGLGGASADTEVDRVISEGFAMLVRGSASAVTVGVMRLDVSSSRDGELGMVSSAASVSVSLKGSEDVVDVARFPAESGPPMVRSSHISSRKASKLIFPGSSGELILRENPASWGSMLVPASPDRRDRFRAFGGRSGRGGSGGKPPVGVGGAESAKGFSRFEVSTTSRARALTAAWRVLYRWGSKPSGCTTSSKSQRRLSRWNRFVSTEPGRRSNQHSVGEIP